MKGLRGLISESSLKGMRRDAILFVITFGYTGLYASTVALKECQEENDRLRKYIKSGEAGKYGGSKKAKRNWDTCIPPMARKADNWTEV